MAGPATPLIGDVPSALSAPSIAAAAAAASDGCMSCARRPAAVVVSWPDETFAVCQSCTEQADVAGATVRVLAVAGGTR